jgi:hypothetical protein
LIIDFAHWGLVFTFVFVVTIIVIVGGTRRWQWRDAFGLNVAHKVSSSLVYLQNIKGNHHRTLLHPAKVGVFTPGICQPAPQSVGTLR